MNKVENFKSSNSLTTFYKLTTLSIKDDDTVDISNLISMSPFYDNYGINGGIVLLHPNTQELLEKGIKPNYSPDSGDYWSNFLVIVVPPYTSTDPDISERFKYSKISKWLYKYTDKSNHQVFNRYLPSSGERTGEADPDYLIGAPSNIGGVYNIGIPFGYDRLSVTTTYTGGTPDKPDKLTVDCFDNNLNSTKYANPWLEDTNLLVFNLKSYNSNMDRYVPTYNHLDYPSTKYSYDVSGLPWDNLDTENLSVLVLDFLAPSVYAQYMLRKRFLKERADGLYLKLVDYIPGLPPGVGEPNPWDDIISQKWNVDNEGYVRVVSTNATTGEVSFKIPLSAGYTNLYEGKLVVKETIAKPARVQFVMYQNRIEWDMDYYLLDSTGKKYLPGVTYHLNELKDYIIAVVPNTDLVFDKNSVDNPGQYCITISNYVRGNDLIRVDLGISNPTFVVTDTSGKFSIKTRVHPISNHLLPVEYVNKIRIYECESYNPTTHDFALGRQVGSSFIYHTEDFTPRDVLLVATMTVNGRIYILGDPVKFTIINPKAV